MNLEGKSCVGGPPLCVWVSGGDVAGIFPSPSVSCPVSGGKNEFMGKFFEKSSENSREISKAGSLSSPSMGKTVKTWSTIDNNEFWGKTCFWIFFEQFLSHVASPGPGSALKCPPWVLRLELLPGQRCSIILHRDSYVFYLNFRKVEQINQKLWTKKGSF